MLSRDISSVSFAEQGSSLSVRMRLFAVLIAARRVEDMEDVQYICLIIPRSGGILTDKNNEVIVGRRRAALPPPPEGRSRREQ